MYAQASNMRVYVLFIFRNMSYEHILQYICFTKHVYDTIIDLLQRKELLGYQTPMWIR